jgi:hypothetical protein
MDKIIKLIVDNHLGDLASVSGLAISIIGFFVTIFNVLRSKAAAVQAKNIVQKVRDDMALTDTVAELTGAINAMDEIKRLQRREAWDILLDRYSALRKSLISIRGSNPNLSNEQKIAFQKAIQFFSSIENQVETMTGSTEPKIDIPRINTQLSKQIDSLHELLLGIKNQIGR